MASLCYPHVYLLGFAPILVTPVGLPSCFVSLWWWWWSSSWSRPRHFVTHIC
ncbi:hypothetical protein LZ31DRAFT_559162 [Colletotrichum somersetense]|nr:hypothetical protein LZ31DRAFT_559162 [Colletotrichum somersetense]